MNIYEVLPIKLKKNHLEEGNQGDKGNERHVIQGLVEGYVVAVLYIE